MEQIKDRYEPDPSLPKEQRSIEKWTELEQQIYHDLIDHFNDDFRTIAIQMTRTFGYKRFIPNMMKRIYFSIHINRDLTIQEMKSIYRVFLENVANLEKFIWKNIQSQFPNWKTWILRKKFVYFVKFGFRKLNCFYTDWQLTELYDMRLARFSLHHINIIFFLAQLEPNLTQSDDKYFKQICKSCRKMVSLLQFWLDKEIIYIDDPVSIQEICVQKNFRLPHIQKHKFEQTMEDILLLDTIIRILCGYAPYLYNEEQAPNSETIQLEITEIPPRTDRNLCKNQDQRKYLKNVKKDIVSYYKFVGKETEGFAYTPLTFNQMYWIGRSKTAQLLIPYITLLQRANVKQKIVRKATKYVRNRYRLREDQFQIVKYPKRLKQQ